MSSVQCLETATIPVIKLMTKNNLHVDITFPSEVATIIITILD
jgi:DNA polymerase sigma